jgi:hypothetical protein
MNSGKCRSLNSRGDAAKLRAKAIRCAFAPLRDIYFQIETLPFPVKEKETISYENGFSLCCRYLK